MACGSPNLSGWPQRAGIVRERAVGRVNDDVSNFDTGSPDEAPVRHSARGKGGRFKPREVRLSGQLHHPTGPGGYDAVVGRRPEGFIPGVRDNSQLQDLERTAHHGRMAYDVRNYNGGRSDAYTAVLPAMYDAIKPRDLV